MGVVETRLTARDTHRQYRDAVNRVSTDGVAKQLINGGSKDSIVFINHKH